MEFWIALAVAVVVIQAIVFGVRRALDKSRELDKQIDYSKIKKWKDDDYT